MCGICGFAGRDEPELARTMTALLAHRGPDGEGVRAFPSVDGRMPATLGHRRLAILDPTPRGAQPMASADGRFWITYNGEIYNFRELRRDLEADGERFRTDCDTEVLLALWARYGPDALMRLNGIFAFGIWDCDRAELFLVRDKLGVKPLYHAAFDGVLYFASEIKALLHALPAPRVDPRRIAEFVTFLWVPDPVTMFDGIEMLPAGHWARFSSAGFELHEYWDMTFADASDHEEQRWVDEVRRVVSGSVRRQMVSDVPLGGFLSGGVDSSAIVAEMSAAAGRVSTYTVGFSREDLAHDIAPDDLKYAREMGRRLAVDYNERVLDVDVVDLLPRLVWHLDEPIADGAAITTYLICAAARERLTVMLSGMGGDELFAGYPRHLAAAAGRVLDLLPAALRRGLAALEPRVTIGPPGRWRGPRRNLKKFLRGVSMPVLDRYLTYLAYYHSSELQALLSADVRAEVADHDPFARHRAHLERVRDEHWLNQMLYLDVKTFLPCLNLTYTDKMSMATSVEVRVPLLDDQLVELSGRLPPSLKLHGTKRKYAFKRSQEGILPHDVIWRPKAGFSAPLRSWLAGPLRPMLDDLLSPDAVAARGLFDPTEVRRLVDAHATGAEDNAFRLWSLLTLEVWQQTFVDGAGGRSLAAAAGR